MTPDRPDEQPPDDQAPDDQTPDDQTPDEQTPGEQAPGQIWECGRCGVPLELGTVKVAYLETEQPVDLWRCPRCGIVMIPEELALGRIVEVEQLLEDK